MKRNDLEFFNENELNTGKYNTYTDLISYHYIRILKTFKSSKHIHWEGFENQLNCSLIEKYFLRFYLPLDALSKKGQTTMDQIKGDIKENIEKINFSKLDDPKIKHLVIMINGLDEFQESYYKQYDFLGAALAEENIASVLLSTPFHLHRTAVLNEDNVKKIMKPSDVLFKNWQNLYYLFDLTFNDIFDLVSKVRGNEHEEDFDFYKNHFSSDVKISLLGYSLGGLISFGAVLKDSSVFDKLILFNAPGNLKDADPKSIKVDEVNWKNTISLISNIADRAIELEKSGFEQDNITNFLHLINGVPTNSMISKINEYKKKILQIVSGGDSVIDMKPWEVYFDHTLSPSGKTQKRVSQFIFSDVGHHLSSDAKGTELLPTIARVISEHIFSNENPSHWQEDEIIVIIKKLLNENNMIDILSRKLDDPNHQKSLEINSLKEILENLDHEKKSQFLKFYYLSKKYFPTFFELIEKKFYRSNETTK